MQCLYKAIEKRSLKIDKIILLIMKEKCEIKKTELKIYLNENKHALINMILEADILIDDETFYELF